jgi:hypothetical protein
MSKKKEADDREIFTFNQEKYKELEEEGFYLKSNSSSV